MLTKRNAHVSPFLQIIIHSLSYHSALLLGEWNEYKKLSQYILPCAQIMTRLKYMGIGVGLAKVATYLTQITYFPCPNE